jgi:hypothetical protein
VLVAFTAAVGAQVAGGHPVPCACFGAGASHTPVSGRTIMRNLVLVTLAVTGAIVQ